MTASKRRTCGDARRLSLCQLYDPEAPVFRNRQFRWDRNGKRMNYVLNQPSVGTVSGRLHFEKTRQFRWIRNGKRILSHTFEPALSYRTIPRLLHFEQVDSLDGPKRQMHTYDKVRLNQPSICLWSKSDCISKKSTASTGSKRQTHIMIYV